MHDRLREYLNSSDTKLSRERIKKYQSAISGLDNSIDDWTRTLEQADERKRKIQTLLLENVAAVLMLGLHGKPRDEAAIIPTPPRSPRRADRSFDPEKSDAETIKIYADSGVASLLASIERELDMMDRC
jgi:hypothetical protein